MMSEQTNQTLVQPDLQKEVEDLFLSLCTNILSHVQLNAPIPFVDDRSANPVSSSSTTSSYNSTTTTNKSKSLNSTVYQQTEQVGSFCFDVFTSSYKGDKTFKDVAEDVYSVNDIIFEQLAILTDFKFAKKMFTNINGVCELVDVLVTKYDGHISYLVVVNWKLNTFSYLKDLFETVLEDRVDELYNSLKRKKILENKQAITPSANVWNKVQSLKTQLETKQENDDDITLPTTFMGMFVAYDDSCYPPPTLDTNSYGINHYAFSILSDHVFDNKKKLCDKKTQMTKLFKNVFENIHVMERYFVLDRIDIQDHTYGILIKFLVKSLIVGEYSEIEQEKKYIATTGQIVRNVFWDFLNRPVEKYDESDDDLDEIQNESSDKHDLNYLMEEKTENFLLEEEETFKY